jgi:glycerophosphoryl diester phosphodiesterase
MWSDFPHPILFAHRGASAYAPENTLEAFQLAFQQGADGIELDVKLSADGEVVVIHDATLERTTNGHGRVESLPLIKLRSLDTGSYFSEDFRGAKIPTLKEVFKIAGGIGIINIELTNYSTPHDTLVQKVCELVRSHGLQKRVLFSSFLAHNLVKAAGQLPEVPRGLLALPGWKGAWARSFGFMFGDYHALHSHLSDADPQQIQRVHRLKRRAHVWTANTEEEVRRLKDWDVDGIFTDDPPTALRALGRGT